MKKRLCINNIFSYAILAILGCAYFWFLQPFYIREYEVPDYFAYYNFWLDRFPAKDGFSSLFLIISSEAIANYTSLHYWMLVLMTGALLITGAALYKLTPILVERLIILLFLFSMGCWYYFYGKIFYEFPFIAINFAILFYLSAPLLSNNDQVRHSFTSNQFTLKCCVAFFLAGLCLSWKAHAIFPLVGLLGLILINNQDLLKTKKLTLIFFLSLFFLGYCLGNFNVFYAPKETLQGIRGYNSGTSFMRFMFDDTLLVWDHVNLLSFNTGVMYWFTTIFALFILPFITIYKKELVILNLALSSLFVFFIYMFLPGWTWQGFPFSLYLIPLLAFLVTHSRLTKLVTLAIVFPVVAIQFYGNFLNYIPDQIRWDSATKSAIQSLVANSKEINSQVLNLIQTNPGNYFINLKVKRKKPGPENADPLETGEPELWKKIYSNQCINPCNPDYTINIESTHMYEVSSYQKLTKDEGISIQGQDYLITLIKHLPSN